MIPYYQQRHLIKPGLTGWAQIKFPYGSSVEDAFEKLRYDLYYIKNHSLFLDAIIIFETVKTVLFGRGGR
jgi:lipopolysaccharide/colanic/teichoic acid biosynthesis glycosyltransferase